MSVGTLNREGIGMSPGRIAAIVIGVLLAVPALGFLVGGAALTVGYVTERADDGYFDVTLDRLSTPTAAARCKRVQRRRRGSARPCLVYGNGIGTSGYWPHKV